jgi:hypothetical protein
MVKLLLWLVAAVLLVLSLGFVKMLTNIYNWRLWPAIRRARREVIKVARQRVPNAGAFSRQGATAINPGYVDFLDYDYTDKERDLLCQDPEIYSQFCNALLKTSYPQDAVSRVHFRIQSQETVDREYGGHWREATEML